MEFITMIPLKFVRPAGFPAPLPVPKITLFRLVFLTAILIGLAMASVARAADGDVLFAKGFGGTGTDVGRAVTIDDSGNIYLAAVFQGTANFGGGSFTSAGGFDMVIAKYSSSRSHLWSKQYGGTGGETPRAIAVDSSGNIIVVGGISGDANLGGGVLTSAGLTDIFIAKYSSTGGFLWAKKIGAASDDTASCLALDGSGNVVVAGYFKSGVDFGGGIIYSAFSGMDSFLAKYSGADGSYIWAKNFPTNADDEAT